MEFIEVPTAILAVHGVQITIGGAMGGVARWLFLQVKLWDGLSAVVLGAILGFYVSPLAAPGIGKLLSGFTTDAEKLPTFAAFATGVAGIGVVGFILDWVGEFRRKHKEAAIDPKPTGGPS